MLNGEGEDRFLENMLFNLDRNVRLSAKEKWDTMRINEHQFICPPELIGVAKTQRELLGNEVAEKLEI